MGTNSDENFDIRRKADHFVEGILTGRYWELAKFDEDRVGIDRRCVLRGEDRQPTHSFYIQIKGRGAQKAKGKVVPLVGSDGSVSQHIEIEHLDYYMKLSVPVFLVVVDVSKAQKVAYWLFVQEYVREKLGSRDWRLPLRKYRAGELKQKPKISIRLPAINRLHDTEKLIDAVRGACGYMASLSIAHGIEHEEEELRRLDPRFDVELTATKGTTDRRAKVVKLSNW